MRWHQNGISSIKSGHAPRRAMNAAGGRASYFSHQPGIEAMWSQKKQFFGMRARASRSAFCCSRSSVISCTQSSLIPSTARQTQRAAGL